MGTAGSIWRSRVLGTTCCALFAIPAAKAATSSSVHDLPVSVHSQQPALALSDIKDSDPELPGKGGLTAPQQDGGIADSLKPAEDAEPSGDSLETDVPHTEQPTAEQIDVTVSNDLSKLPAPVLRMRELIIEAAVRGDIEALRPLLGTGPTRTELSISGYEGDPIEFLKEISGDGSGHELLAILLDIFQAGYAHVDAGEPTELYLWPYFYSVPLDSLNDRQRVELFRIITAGDYEDMLAFGGYIFYRTAIGPEGDWKFFVAGD